MGSPGIRRLLDRLDAGESPEAIVDSLRSEAEVSVLKRAAAVRSFDEALFSEVLAAGSPDSPTFDQFVGGPDVEELSPDPPVYRLLQPARLRYRRRWWPPDADALQPLPPDLRALSAELAERYRRAGRARDELYHLALADQERAVELFRRLYEEADEHFDLAGCQDALDALVPRDDPERLLLIGPTGPLGELFQANDLRLRVRGEYSADYFRTGRYLSRAGFQAQVHDLLGGDTRALHLYATGGMGKTMQLRWLVARHCVPQRIPVGRIDFDDIDLIAAGRMPWLLAVELARQLVDQFPGRPLALFVQENREHLSQLASWRPGPAAPPSAGTAWTVEGITEDFCSRLAEAAGSRPVLLIFDTIEQALLHGGTEWLHGLFRPMIELCPPARLVVCGRETELTRAFEKALPSLRSERVPPFTAEEAGAYLTGIRGRPDDDVRRAVIHRADGVPLKLALLADAVEQDPGLTAAAIDAYEDADLLYLIERVVERIPEYPVRWLLRYGVVVRPGRLTLRLAEDLLQPLLARAMAGDPNLDEPGRGIPEVRGQKREPFRPVAESERLPMSETWRLLSRYAASSSWVSIEGDSLRFQPEVVEPMRRLLRDGPAYHILNEEAARYYERLAVAEPERWGTWIREAVYHRFQADAAGAPAYWREQSARAAAMGRPTWRYEMAQEVIKLAASRPDVLVAANYEAAAALAEATAVRQEPVDRERAERADAHLTRARDLQAERRIDVVSAPRMDLVEASLALNEGGAERAQELLEPALAAADDPAERAELSAALAESLAAQGDPKAAGRYEDALRLVGDLATGAAAGSALVLQVTAMLGAAVGALASALRVAGRSSAVIRSYADNDLVLDALQVWQATRNYAAQSEPARLPELARLRAELDLRAGRPFQALDRLRGSVPPPEDAALRLRHRLLRGRAALAALRPLEALSTLDRLAKDLAAAKSAVTAFDAGWLEAETLELRGEALVALGELVPATEALERSGELWGDVDAGCRTRVARAMVHLNRGATSRARVLLEQVDSLTPTPGGETWLGAQLAWTELEATEGETGVASERVADTLSRLASSGAPPGRVVRAAVAGLAIAGHPAALVDDLVLALAKVQSAGARLALLGDLARCPALKAPGTALDELRDLVQSRDGEERLGPPLPQDGTLQRMRQAEVQRATGRRSAARRRLASVRRDLKQRKEWFALRDALEAGIRAGEPVDAGDVELVRAAFREHPAVLEPLQPPEPEAVHEATGAPGARSPLVRLASTLVTGRPDLGKLVWPVPEDPKRQLVELLAARPAELADVLGRVLEPFLSAIPYETDEVRLDIERSLQPLPWELAVPPSAFPGPAWPLARRQRHRLVRTRAGGDPPAGQARGRGATVLHVTAAATTQSWTHRGDLLHGFDVAQIYEVAGFRLTRIEDPSADRFQRLASELPAATLVHVSAGIARSGRALALDFGEQAVEGERAATLTSSRLARLLAGGPRPSLIVLDVPRPPSKLDAARMLVLRNLFAADLYELLDGPAILAAGLAGDGGTAAWMRFITALGWGKSIGEAVQRLRTSLALGRGDGFDPETALAATALFTRSALGPL